MQIRILPLTVLLAGLLSSTAFAAHPLITDDTGTQGKGKFQLEVNGELSRQKNEGDEGTTRESAKEVSTAITYGIIDNLDVALGLPYQWKWQRGEPARDMACIPRHRNRDSQRPHGSG